MCVIALEILVPRCRVIALLQYGGTPSSYHNLVFKNPLFTYLKYCIQLSLIIERMKGSCLSVFNVSATIISEPQIESVSLSAKSEEV